MRQKVTILLTGMALGAILFGGVNAYAAVLAERSSHKVTVDGKPVSVEAYNINGSNYFQLRDLARLLDVSVEWNGATRTVEISTEGGYTEEPPVQRAAKSSIMSSKDELYQMRLEVAALTNDVRRQNGVPALIVDDDLMAAAQVRADEVAITLAYRHDRPDGSDNDTVVQHTGQLLLGENLGAKDYRGIDPLTQLAQIQIDSWSSSEGHYRNMLHTKYHSLGIGIAQDRFGMYYIVQVFAGGEYTITGIDDPILR